MTTGSGQSAGMDYVLRLAERFDGRATSIDGSYVASDASRGGSRHQITRDPRAAMRFAEPGAAERFRVQARTPAPPDIAGSVAALMRAYAVDVVAVRRPMLRRVTGAATTAVR